MSDRVHRVGLFLVWFRIGERAGSRSGEVRNPWRWPCARDRNSSQALSSKRDGHGAFVNDGVVIAVF